MVPPELLTPYTVNLAGVTRDLPRIEIAPGVVIALVNILGDTALTEAVAHALVAKLPPETEVLITPEAKSIPLIYAMAVKSGLPYVVLRKTRKPYMNDAISAEVVTITTGTPQLLWMDGKDIDLVRGRNILFVDDVISTGSTLRGAETLIKDAGGHLIASAAIMVEGDNPEWDAVLSLGRLPVWFAES
jgi:adenine phosphoribosyltransferase